MDKGTSLTNYLGCVSNYITVVVVSRLGDIKSTTWMLTLYNGWSVFNSSSYKNMFYLFAEFNGHQKTIFISFINIY